MDMLSRQLSFFRRGIGVRRAQAHIWLSSFLSLLLMLIITPHYEDIVVSLPFTLHFGAYATIMLRQRVYTITSPLREYA